MNNTQASEQQAQGASGQQGQNQQNSTEPQAQNQQTEKLFTQADVDRIVGNRLARMKQDTETTEQYRRERDEARKELEEYKNNAFLKEKGVMDEYKEFVIFKAGQLMDDNTNFRQAVEKFLKTNPRFTGKGYRVVSTGRPDGGHGTSGTASDTRIREAMGLKG